MKLSKQHLYEAVTNKIFTLCILPTEQCNFRCVYCYEDFKLERMSTEIVNAIKKFIQKRIESDKDLQVFNIMWFGGEPLVAKDIIMDIGQFTHDLCQQYHIRHEESATTNGYLLTKKTLRRFHQFHLTHFQITLDGPREVHNKTRLHLNGRGTFDTIWHHLMEYRSTDLDFQIILRLHISPYNIAAVKNFLPQLKAIFYGDKRFIFFPKIISDLGGPHCGKVPTFSWQEGKAIENQIKAYLEEENIFTQRISSGDKACAQSSNGVYTLVYEQRDKRTTQSPLERRRVYTPRSPICYASATNNIVIRANGRLAKCTVAFTDPTNDIGFIDLEGNLRIEQKKINYWTRGVVNQVGKICYCPRGE